LISQRQGGVDQRVPIDVRDDFGPVLELQQPGIEDSSEAALHTRKTISSAMTAKQSVAA